MEMSLRFKIILLFVGLAIVPMLTVAAFGYWQAHSLLVTTAQGRLSDTAARVARELESRGTEIDEALGELARSPAVGRIQPGEGNEAEILALLPPRLDQAAFLRISGAGGFMKTLAGTLPPEPMRLDGSESSALLEFSTHLPGSPEGQTVMAGFWAGDLFPRDARNPGSSLILVDVTTGRVLFNDGVAGPRAGDRVDSSSALANALLAPGRASGAFRFHDAGEARLGASATIHEKGWALVATASAGVALAALNRLVGAYWAFVIGLAVFTGLAFSTLLGRFTKSLRDLTDAAEHIGTGELDPWLPLPATGEVGQLTLAFSRMLERIREMMTQVDQNGRLAAVGQLSAYLAHEIRNPLTSVKLNLQRMNRWAQQGRLPEFCLEPLQISLREMERLNASVSDVLQLSRSEDSPQELLSLHDLLSESDQLLRPRFARQGVELRLDLDANADRILARPGQVKSVAINLMLNALEAQPQGGYLEIRSELAWSPGFHGPMVAVHFKDGGAGVPPELRDRIFEPFFTTKAGGSGIGLAVASRIVAENHGRLYLEPFPTFGSGAEFVMALPLASVKEGAVATKDRFPRFLNGQWHNDREGFSLPEPWSPVDRGISPHHLTAEGIEAVLALSISDLEEVN